MTSSSVASSTEASRHATPQQLLTPDLTPGPENERLDVQRSRNRVGKQAEPTYDEKIKELYTMATPNVKAMMNKPNIDKRILSGTNTKITNLNKRYQVADKSRQLDLRLLQTLYTEANNTFKRWDQSKKGIDTQPENDLELALKNIERMNEERGYPEDWQFEKPSMIEYKPLNDWISSSTRLNPANLETATEKPDTQHSDAVKPSSSSAAQLAEPVAESHPIELQEREELSSGTTVSNTTEASSSDSTQSNATETIEVTDTRQSNATVQAEPQTTSDITGAGEGEKSFSDPTVSIPAEPSSSDPQSKIAESTEGGVHSDGRADLRDRQTVYREALVNGYTSKGEEIISHRNVGKNGKQYLIESGHPECPFPLYQLVPGGELTIWERKGYDIELAKKNRREIKSHWEGKSTVNKSEFDEALAVARAWSDNSSRAQVTFVWIRLKNGQSIWISRTNFGKLIHSKKTGDTSIIALERELDEKREAWYREKKLSPPRPFIRPRIIKVSNSRTTDENPSSGENTRSDSWESPKGAANAAAGNISQLAALQGEVNELKGMLRELMQREE